LVLNHQPGEGVQPLPLIGGGGVHPFPLLASEEVRGREEWVEEGFTRLS
jgi:hypothetical protein